MSFFWGGFCSNDSSMLSLEVFLIGESLNNDPAQLHGDSDVPSDQVSNVHAGDVITSCIVVCPNAGTTASTGGLTIEKKTHPYFVVCFIPMEDEVESPRSNPPRNTIDLCLEAMTIQVIPRWPFIPSLPPLRKPSVTKEYLPIALLAYSLVHEEVRSYASSFLTYESIVEFLNLIEFCHIGRSYVMFVESCRESEHVFIRAFLCETHVMYIYSSFFSIHLLTIPFDKFKVDVLRELNVAPTPKFLHHYTIKEIIKSGWISFTDIFDKVVIRPYTTFYKNCKVHFFQVRPGPESMPIYFTWQGVPRFPFD